MKQWGPDLLQARTEAEPDPAWLAWNTPMTGFSHIVRFNKLETTSELAPGGDFLRILCHVLVDSLPFEGVEEVYEAILDSCQFHLERRETLAHTSLQPEKLIQGKRGKVYERPDFSLVED